MPSRDLCESCAATLPYNHLACPRCALPLPFQSDEPCGLCQKRPPAYDRSFALFHYEEPARHLIRTLKFHNRYPNARLLGEMLADALVERTDQPELLIPVPLHHSRYRERGYNQTLEIARHLARRLPIALDFESCIRARPTQPQTELKGKERRRNMKRAFALARPVTASHVAILDDVVTTGTTVNELAKVLRKAGVARLDVWACARAGGNT